MLQISDAYGQRHRFSVHRGGKEIGEITAVLTHSLNTETYRILSDVSFKVLWKRYRRRTNNLVIYEGEKMKASRSGVYLNNDLQDSTALNQQSNSYNVFKYPNDRYKIDSVDLGFTTAKLYFKEPVGINEVYSERFLQYCPLEVVARHKYKLSLPDGKLNYYRYEDQKLVEVSIDRTWFNLEFRKK